MAKDLHLHQYQALLSVDNIRLLVLEPGSKDDPVRCSLKEVSLDEAECKYEAISYVWGRSIDSIDIECDGKKLSIRANLHHALQTFRHPTNQRPVWADAICINQKDHAEKGYQVRQMGKVYEKASRVLCWLGEDSQGIAKRCFDLVREAYRQLSRQWKDGWDSQNYLNDLVLPKLINEDTREEWQTFRSLLRLPWFERLCILGEHEVELYEIIELASWWAESLNAPREDGSIRTGLILAYVFMDIHSTYDNTPTWRVKSPIVKYKLENLYPKEKQLYVDLLFCAQNLKVSDQRDIIYSSLGSPLALDRGNLMVEPDYGEGLEDLHIRAAHALLLNPREAPHTLLRVVHNTKEALNDGGYPTWVPRWTTFSDTDVRAYPLTHTYEHRLKPYCASRGSLKFEARTIPGNKIAVNGLIVDHVSWTSFILKVGDFRSNVQLWEPRFRDAKTSAIEVIWQDLLDKVKQPPEQLARELSLAVTRGRPGSSHYVNNFLAYCELVRSLVGSENPSPFPAPASDQAAPSEGELAITRCNDRRLAWTTNERLALIPVVAEEGDVCCIIQGMDTPVILRRTLCGTYKFVGDAYVNGVMDGELMEAASREPTIWEEIQIE